MSIQAQRIPGRRSELCIIFPEPHRRPDRPLLLLAHGALRSSEELLPWALLWTGEFDVALVDLPGHGRSPAPAEISFAAYVDEFRFLAEDTFANRRVVIIGESLSGAMALAAANQGPANLAAVVALDPPLSTPRLRPIADFARAAFEQHPHDQTLKAFFFEMFGVRAGSTDIEDRHYTRHLDQLSAPALVLAGQRIGRSGDAPMPSLLDTADRDLLRRKPIIFQEVAGVGHHLIDLRPTETHAAARDFILGLRTD